MGTSSCGRVRAFLTSGLLALWYQYRRKTARRRAPVSTGLMKDSTVLNQASFFSSSYHERACCEESYAASAIQPSSSAVPTKANTRSSRPSETRQGCHLRLGTMLRRASRPVR